MKRAIYDGAPDAYRRVCQHPSLYIAPKARLPILKGMVDCPLVAVEDITKTATSLWLNEMVQPGTRIVLDRVSRYYKVESDKARKLSRLAEIGEAYLVDVVPFCEHRKYLYMPWRYVSRTILGYQHHYAFAGGHYEEVDGRVVHSLDCGLLANKVAPHVESCWERRPGPAHSQHVPASTHEQAEYTEKRAALFAKCRTPQPIVTRLADLSHGFQSRRDAVCDLLGKRVGVICNMASYAAYYKHAKPGCVVGTYAKPPQNLASCNRVVYAEPPIVQTYRRLDIDAMLAPGTTTIDVLGDTKVDRYLGGRLASELGEIDGFIEVLRASL